jgi:hypothetical protein
MDGYIAAGTSSNGGATSKNSPRSITDGGIPNI